MPKTSARRGKFDKSPSRSRSRSRSSHLSSASSNSSESSHSKSRSGSHSSSRSASQSRSRSPSRTPKSRSVSKSPLKRRRPDSASSSSSQRSSASSVSNDNARSKQRPARPQPPSNKIYVNKLTKNVTVNHLTEIFENYGSITKVNFPLDKWHPHLGRGFATIIFDKSDDADKALKYMDGGQIDGREISVSKTNIPLFNNNGGNRRRKRRDKPFRDGPWRRRRRG